MLDIPLGNSLIKSAFEQLDTVRNFEQTLADNGTHIIKIFLHLD